MIKNSPFGGCAKTIATALEGNHKKQEKKKEQS